MAKRKRVSTNINRSQLDERRLDILQEEVDARKQHIGKMEVLMEEANSHAAERNGLFKKLVEHLVSQPK